MGFEPMRAKPIGFRVQLLNHSDTVSFLALVEGRLRIAAELSDYLIEAAG